MISSGPIRGSSERGFSLIELVASAAIFLLLSILIFAFFRFGTRSFQEANTRHGLQVDALRVMESIQAELKRSNIASVDHLHGSDDSREATVADGTVDRDALCFVTLQNWQDKTNPNNFDLESQAPLWNRYLIYYSTRDEIGRLLRLKIDPNPPPQGAKLLPRDDFEGLVFDNPTLNQFDGKTAPYVELAKNVLEFKVLTLDDDTDTDINDATAASKLQRGEILASLKLKQKKQKGPVGPGPIRDFDYYELRVNIRPENSYPNNL